jgi:response regulator RpfG family c-di-GMP phosphodiesterase
MITTLMSEIDPDAPMTVLIVEDEVLIRLDSADRLRAEGYTVIEASNVTKLSSSFSNLS